ncbi:prepilin peptidase [Glycomyces sp. TRM65418]|uniref:prepilin peptidase n=1 Tax=Glycomyces sp. TRM65418 TaxID=2867006 RepID=UPI001CE63383|nr:prepilin peptidase [Glycomyces sp. TRM65418]MCC3764380.1 prepilin peptidase [Glycomyces sp. TRM65418]QZD54057.1 prepilin peptidase [Glycomyces sp. TRM65418]
MLFIGAVTAALLTSPGLARCVALATDRHPDPRLVAAVSVASALLIAWRAEGLLYGCALGVVAAVGIPAGWIDVYQRRLPDLLILPAYPLTAALLLASGDADAMLRAAACAAAGMALYGVGCVAGHVGFGDVKLAGLLGLVLGWMSWQSALAAAVAAALIGGVQAVAVLLMRRIDLPFGPAMLLGTAAALAVTNMDIIHLALIS